MAVVTRLYDTYEMGQSAVERLTSAGVSQSEISIVANNTDYAGSGMKDTDNDGVDDRSEGAGTGVGVGATVGGAAGLLAGLGLMAIPGIGPVVAAGWLAATALGAAVGGAAGGIIGALTQAGVSEEDAHVYAEGVRRGGTLVTVRTSESDRARVESLLDQSAVDTRQRGDAYRTSGWTGFDTASSGMSAEEIRRERERQINR